MKILIIKEVYPDYEKFFYEKYNVVDKNYNQQKNQYHEDFFAWANSWCYVLQDKGYQVYDIVFNMVQMQTTWANENLEHSREYSLIDITMEQIKKIKPDIIWCFPKNYELILRIREEYKCLKLLMGWIGSAIPYNAEEIFPLFNIIWTCAPENIKKYKDRFTIKHIHNAFDERVIKKVRHVEQKDAAIFIGSIVRGLQYHNEREKLLISLSKQMNLKIYTPSFYITYSDIAYSFLKKNVYKFNKVMGNIGIGKYVPILQKIKNWENEPLIPVDIHLKSILYKPLFGIEMFQAIADSLMTLNIHADSSPQYASNMRLFEITGMGSCMITDWKDNLGELFIPDEEVVVYRDFEECIEKMKWMYDHPDCTRKIAIAGQRRCLSDHTFKNRVNIVDETIRSYLEQ